MKEKKTERLELVMTKTDKQKLYKLAQEKDIPVGQLIRGLIKEAIKEVA